MRQNTVSIMTIYRTILALFLVFSCNISSVYSSSSSSSFDWCTGNNVYKFLIAPADSTCFSTIRARLEAQLPSCTQVHTFDATAMTPTVEQLSEYDVVMTWGNYQYNDPSLFGDNLATYIDSGGAVVIAVFATTTNAYSYAIQGRFASDWYMPHSISSHKLSNEKDWSFDPNLSNFNHPVMDGIDADTQFPLRYYAPLVKEDLRPGTQLIGAWVTPPTMAMFHNDHVFVVNSAPCYSNDGDSTNLDKLYANALMFSNDLAFNTTGRSWQALEWGSCTLPDCQQSRTVQCVGADGQLYDKRFCTSFQQPTETRACTQGICGLAWTTTAFSQCSAQCTQERTVTCANSSDPQGIYADELCLRTAEKPQARQACMGGNCPYKTCTNRTALWIGSSNSGIPTMLSALGWSVATSFSPPSTDPEYYKVFSVVALIRVNGNAAIAEYARNGGSLISEWSAAAWFSSSGLVQGTIQPSVSNTDLYVHFNERGLRHALLTKDLPNPFNDDTQSNRLEFFYGGSGFIEEQVLAYRSDSSSEAVLLHGNVQDGSGIFTICFSDWQDGTYTDPPSDNMERFVRNMFEFTCAGTDSYNDTDRDGTPDEYDLCPYDSAKISPSLCGCGRAETRDSDGDGTIDCLDLCPNDPDKLTPGQCGCGVADVGDSDGDGTIDCSDNCPFDRAKIDPGVCGCGLSDTKDNCDVSWHSTAWSSCGVSCTQYRTVTCRNANNTRVNDSFCINWLEGNAQVKPTAKQDCETGSCTHSWWTSEWSSCALNCTHSRTVLCRNSGNRTVSHRYCLYDSSLPASVSACTSSHCARYGCTDKSVLWIGGAYQQIPAMLEAQGWSVTIVASVPSTSASYYESYDIVVLLRRQGNDAIASYARSGGRLIGEWSASTWFGNSGLVQGSYTSDVHGTDLSAYFTQRGLDAHDLSKNLPNPFSDASQGARMEYWYGATGHNVSHVYAYRSDDNQQPAILHGFVQSGIGLYTLFLSDWYDGAYASSPIDTDMQQIVLNMFEFTCSGNNAPANDTDRDGVIAADGCPTDPNKVAPGLCGCNQPETPDTDSDGTVDCLDECMYDPGRIKAGACGCSTPEIDDDGDGVPSCIDGCPNDPLKIAPGICGCGTADMNDTDADGTLDCVDECPNDPYKSKPGVCGCGATDAPSSCAVRWNMSAFSPCEFSCTKLRVVQCVGPDNATVINSSFCMDWLDQNQPAQRKSCEDGACYHQWVTSPFSQTCAANCTVHRGVYCKNSGQRLADDRYCLEAAAKPDSFKTCRGDQCVLPNCRAGKKILWIGYTSQGIPAMLDQLGWTTTRYTYPPSSFVSFYQPFDIIVLARTSGNNGIRDWARAGGRLVGEYSSATWFFNSGLVSGSFYSSSLNNDHTVQFNSRGLSSVLSADLPSSFTDSSQSRRLQYWYSGSGYNTSHVYAVRSDSAQNPAVLHGTVNGGSGSYSLGLSNWRDGYYSYPVNDNMEQFVVNLMELACDDRPSSNSSNVPLDSDDDGVPDSADLCPGNPNKIVPGLCGCELAETRDRDGDTVPDCIDECPLDPLKTSPGQCGCGEVEGNDSDGDQILDCADLCPNDALKSAPGVCGCGYADNKQTCSVSWYTGYLYSCSSACVRTRTVECRSEAGTVVNDSYCLEWLDGVVKPNSTFECEAGSCSVDWQTGQWSSCNSSCVHSRTVQCMNSGGRVVDEYRCLFQHARPAEFEFCSSDNCTRSSCSNKNVLWIGKSYQNIPVMLRTLGWVVTVVSSAPAYQSAYNDYSIVALIRMPGNSYLETWVRDGGYIITEWSAVTFLTATTNLLPASSVSSVSGRDLSAIFTEAGLSSVFSNKLPNSFNDAVGSRMEFWYTVSNPDPTHVIAYRSDNQAQPAILHGRVSNGVGTYTAFLSDWSDGSYAAPYTDNMAQIVQNLFDVCTSLGNSSEARPDADFDGVPDDADECPDDRYKVAPGLCGCGVFETRDSDGDKVIDCLDGCRLDTSKVEPGACGCNVPDVDSDGDGTPNCIDECPSDANKTASGACLCGVPDRKGECDVYWKTFEYSQQCTSECRNPRAVGCVRADNVTLIDNNFCDSWLAEPMPPTWKRCYGGPGSECRVHWSTNDTSICSDKCIKHRDIQCVDTGGYHRNESECLVQQPRPLETVACRGGVCPVPFCRNKRALFLSAEQTSLPTLVRALGWSVYQTHVVPSTLSSVSEYSVVILGTGMNGNDVLVQYARSGGHVVTMSSAAEWAFDAGLVQGISAPGPSGDSSATFTDRGLSSLFATDLSHTFADDSQHERMDSWWTAKNIDWNQVYAFYSNQTRVPALLHGTVLGGSGTYTLLMSDIDHGTYSSVVSDTMSILINNTISAICGVAPPIGNSVDPDADNDGSPDGTDLCPNNPFKVIAGTCGCASLETPDQDGDGVVDCVDECPLDANKLKAGYCGCGYPETDADGDGTPGCADLCDSDPNKISPGVCGCGTPDVKGACNVSWHAPDFDFCPRVCTQSRILSCRGPGSVPVNHSYCESWLPSGTRPLSQRECSGDACTVEWRVSSWSSCSFNCTKTRQVSCVNSGNKTIANKLCLAELPLPPSISACDGSDCQKQSNACTRRSIAWIGRTSSGIPVFLQSLGWTVSTYSSVPSSILPSFYDNFDIVIVIRTSGSSALATWARNGGRIMAEWTGIGFIDDFNLARGTFTSFGVSGVDLSVQFNSRGLASSLLTRDLSNPFDDSTQHNRLEYWYDVSDFDPSHVFAVRSDDSNAPAILHGRIPGGQGTYTLLLSDFQDGSYAAPANDEMEYIVRNLFEFACASDRIDSDGDGTSDAFDKCPLDSLKVAPGLCGCNMTETRDSDMDSVADCLDGCPNDPLKTQPGICGCGVVDDLIDSDMDSVPDCLDACPNDPLKTQPGICGCGVRDTTAHCAVQWKTYAWGECASNCRQNRTIDCRNDVGELIPDYICTQWLYAGKPVSEQACGGGACSSCANKNILYIGSTGQGLASFLRSAGWSVSTASSPPSSFASYYNAFSIVVVSRRSGNDAIRDWVKQGGRIVTEWSAATFLSNTGLVSGSFSSGPSGTDLSAFFTPRGLAAPVLSSNVPNPFSDSSQSARMEFWYNAYRYRTDHVYAYRNDDTGQPAILSGTVQGGTGKYFALLSDWQDGSYSYPPSDPVSHLVHNIFGFMCQRSSAPIIDSDNDGTPDRDDLCPNDPLKVLPGICGCGVRDMPGYCTLRWRIGEWTGCNSLCLRKRQVTCFNKNINSTMPAFYCNIMLNSGTPASFSKCTGGACQSLAPCGPSRKVLWIGTYNQGVPAMLRAIGWTVVTATSPPSVYPSDYNAYSIVALIRTSGNYAIAEWARQGGRIITEWSATPWLASSNLMNGTVSRGPSGQDLVGYFTPRGMDASALSRGLGASFADGSQGNRLEYFYDVSNYNPTHLYAYRSDDATKPMILSGRVVDGAGLYLALPSDWSDGRYTYPIDDPMEILVRNMFEFVCDKSIDIGPDSDGDGVANDKDKCPHDPRKTLPGVCGCGRSESSNCREKGQKVSDNFDSGELSIALWDTNTTTGNIQASVCGDPSNLVMYFAGDNIVRRAQFQPVFNAAGRQVRMDFKLRYGSGSSSACQQVQSNNIIRVYVSLDGQNWQLHDEIDDIDEYANGELVPISISYVPPAILGDVNVYIRLEQDNWSSSVSLSALDSIALSAGVTGAQWEIDDVSISNNQVIVSNDDDSHSSVGIIIGVVLGVCFVVMLGLATVRYYGIRKRNQERFGARRAVMLEGPRMHEPGAEVPMPIRVQGEDVGDDAEGIGEGNIELSAMHHTSYGYGSERPVATVSLLQAHVRHSSQNDIKLDSDSLQRSTLQRRASSTTIDTCSVCFNDIGEFSLTRGACDHWMCRSCTVDVVSTAIDIGEQPMWCPGCRRSGNKNGAVHAGTLLGLIEHEVLPPHLSQKVAETQLLSQGPEHGYQDTVSAVECPGCHTVAAVVGPTRNILCAHCQVTFCRHCRVMWHTGQTCDQYQQMHAQNMDEKDQVRLVNAGAGAGAGAAPGLGETSYIPPCGAVKNCPSCSKTEMHFRGHGMHHVNAAAGCSECGHHWCFSCGGDYPCANGCPLFCTSVGDADDCGCAPCPECTVLSHCHNCDADHRCASAMVEKAYNASTTHTAEAAQTVEWAVE
jgi:Thrombospondin type 1 domain